MKTLPQTDIEIKIANKEILTDDEIAELVYSDDVIDEKDRDVLRWTRSMFTVVELNGKTYGIEWQKGLTEMQEDVFLKQPYEVEKHEKVITVTEWQKVTT